MSQTDLMTQTATVYSTTYGQDNSGGLRKVRGPVRQTGVVCAVWDTGSHQDFSAGARTAFTSHMIYTQYAGTQNGDEWEVFTEGVSEGVFRVTDPPNVRRGKGGIETAYVIGVEEINL